MMVLETTERNQSAILWTIAGHDNYGDVTLNDPIEIKVRWEHKQSEQLVPDGSKISVVAEVVVDRDIDLESILWLGTLADLPTTPTELKQVIFSRKIPDIKGRHYRRVVSLMVYSNSLPELA